MFATTLILSIIRRYVSISSLHSLFSLGSAHGQPHTNQEIENGWKDQTRRSVGIRYKIRSIPTHEEGNGQGNKHFEFKRIGIISTNPLSGKGSNVTGNSRIVRSTTQVGRVHGSDRVCNAIGNGGKVKDPVGRRTLSCCKVVCGKQKGARQQKGGTRVFCQVVQFRRWNQGAGNGRSGNVTGQDFCLKFEKVEPTIGKSNGASGVGARDGSNRLFGALDEGTLEATAVNVSAVECHEKTRRDTKLDGKCRSASSGSRNGSRVTG
mmetsp:Transcript_17697/g.31976  ORF Transcript_17697/g.31976 Transcript_17697/m.31976 type:complete len:264 (+) Transcript_17697:18-809(+)